MPQLSMHSPVGDLTISEDGGAIVSLDWGWGAIQTDTPLLLKAKDQLEHYFDGDRSKFALPLIPHGTPYQQKVWAAMRRIPYGRTATYGELAKSLDSAARAVGRSCGQNPLPILIPCHRVVGADGKLGGYSGDGGLETKTALLRLEGAWL